MSSREGNDLSSWNHATSIRVPFVMTAGRHHPESFSSELEPAWLAWQATLDPRALWPSVTPITFDEVSRAIVGVTRQTLLPHAAPTELTLTEGTTRALGPAAYAAGMGSLLGYWIAVGQLAVDDQVRLILATHLDHGRRRFAKLDAVLSSTIDAFATHRISPTILKGMHTARSYFPDPGARPLADIDLLVNPKELPATSAVLSTLGFTERRRTATPFRSEWVANDLVAEPSLELNHVDNPWSIDLHTTLERRYFRGCTAGFDHREIVTQDLTHPGGVTLRTLAQPLLTAFLAMHGSYALHQLQLIRIVELVMVMRQDSANGTLDWVALAELLHRTGTSRFVYPAITLAEGLVPGTVDPDLLDAIVEQTPPRTRSIVEKVLGHGTFRLASRSLEDKLMWARGPVDLACNLSELLWPSDQRLSPRQRLKAQGRFVKNLITRRTRDAIRKEAQQD